MAFRPTESGSIASATSNDVAIGLDRLECGELARIDSVDKATDRRFLEIGLCPGTLIRLLRRAPLGDPMIFEFRGAQFALRSAEARSIRAHRLS